ncbi:MAG: apolipoprotein N-acyltransferase, partial [Candidatus Competibacteraceae bacterium]|nr:apolipoprotein N-acyltransferase [Candidatus Competibacteraceae bacterium]
MDPALFQRVRHSPMGPVLALLLGTAWPLAFAPFGLFPLAILLPAALLWLWDGTSPRRAAITGLAFGLGAFGVGIAWIHISLHTYGNAPLAFALLATFLVILLMALYPALLGWLLNRLLPRPGPLRWLLGAPALAVVLEWVRSWAFSGFPWLSPGYSQIDGPLGGLAPLAGVFAVGWGVWLSAGLLCMVVGQEGRNRWLALAGLVVLWGSAWLLKGIDWTH